MTKFIFVDGNGNIDIEVEAVAQNECEARKIAWNNLTEEQKDACGCLECVDELPA